MIEPGHPDLLVRRQCDLLALARSGLYYERRGESPENLQLMRLIDEAYTRWPFYGVRKMAAYLCREGHEVNVKRVRRLMCLMGLEAIYPRKRLGAPGEAHRRYPYLLAGVESSGPIRCGAPTSHTSGCRGGSCISWRSWTGTAGMFYPGRCR